MSGAWRGLSVSFPLSLHLQINSLLTEKKINNQNCHNETVSAKPFNWSMESECNYLRNNCMKKEEKKKNFRRDRVCGDNEVWECCLAIELNGGSWKSELEKYLLNNSEVTKSTSIVLSGVSQKKKKKNWKDKIALCTIWNSLMDRWMDGFALLLV